MPRSAAPPAAPAEPQFWEAEEGPSLPRPDTAQQEQHQDQGGAPVEPAFWEVPDVPDADPDPGYAAAGAPAPVATFTGMDDVPLKTRKDIAGVLGLFVMMPADLLIMLDPYCGEVFMKCAPNMVKAMVPIICQSEAAVEFIVSKAGLILWGNLFMAAKPLISAVIAHHVTKKVAVRRDEEGRPAGIEQSDYSRYSAA